MAEDKKTISSRRDFLVKTAKVTALSVVLGGSAYLLSHRKEDEIDIPVETVNTAFTVNRSKVYPDMVIARGSSPAANTSAVVAGLGGMEQFINSGDRVAVKPNLGWDRTPEQAANTNPEVVGEVVRLCMEAGAAEVVVTDNACNDPRRTFVRSGIQDAVYRAGGKTLIPSNKDYKDMNLGGSMLNVWSVLEPLISVDKMINIPVVKHHSLSKATIAMKNLYGILGGRRNQLHQKIDESIVDLAAFMRPTLTIIDATRVLMSNGPSGGSLDDVKTFNTVLGGTDQVALDSYSSFSFLGLQTSDVPYLGMGQERNLGVVDFSQLNIKEEQTG